MTGAPFGLRYFLFLHFKYCGFAILIENSNQEKTLELKERKEIKRRIKNRRLMVLKVYSRLI